MPTSSMPRRSTSRMQEVIINGMSRFSRLQSKRRTLNLYLLENGCDRGSAYFKICWNLTANNGPGLVLGTRHINSSSPQNLMLMFNVIVSDIFNDLANGWSSSHLRLSCRKKNNERMQNNLNDWWIRVDDECRQHTFSTCSALTTGRSLVLSISSYSINRMFWHPSSSSKKNSFHCGLTTSARIFVADFRK